MDVAVYDEVLWDHHITPSDKLQHPFACILGLLTYGGLCKLAEFIMHTAS